jgi:hypothetical protein
VLIGEDVPGKTARLAEALPLGELGKSFAQLSFARLQSCIPVSAKIAIPAILANRSRRPQFASGQGAAESVFDVRPCRKLRDAVINR